MGTKTKAESNGMKEIGPSQFVFSEQVTAIENADADAIVHLAGGTTVRVVGKTAADVAEALYG